VITVDDPCYQEAEYTFYVEDDCENSDTEVITVIREYDLIENCETAYGRIDNGDDECFIDHGFSQWGWTNEITQPGTYTLDMYAGAAHCDTNNGAFVGTATVTYDGTLVDVAVELETGNVASAVHVYIGCDMFPVGPNGNPTVAPGQYNFISGPLNYVENYYLEDVEVTGDFWIIVHAVTCELTCECSGLPGVDVYDGSTIDPIDCPDSDPIISTAGGFEGVNVDNKVDFTAYPVPFDGIVNIDYNFDYESFVNIYVFDITGRVIREIQDYYYQGSVGKNSIDLEGEADQIYFIKLVTKYGVSIKKVVSSNYRD
jgi:hypothetical protein